MDPVVADYLREKADALRRHENAIRTGVPDSVRRARVAVRKIRSALRVFAADDAVAADLDDRLRAWGEVLGRARDAEPVRDEIMSDDEAGRVGHLSDDLDRRQAEEHERARAAVVELLDTPEHSALLRDLDRLIGPADTTVSGDSAPLVADEPVCDEARFLIAAARSARARFRLRERQAARQARADVEAAWHRARQAAKRARSAAGLVGDAVPNTPDRARPDSPP